MKILIAEDDLVTRELLKRILSHMADEIVEAGDGIEALEKIETEEPDFIFTDLQMPELDGRALLEAIRASKEHSEIPVVCMSAVKDKEEVTALLALGIQDYILKPIRPAEVHDRFRKVIALHSGWRKRQGAGGDRVMMVVDPDPNFREFVKPFLEEHFTVMEAVSGAHALRLFKESELKPTLVVAAIGLPLVNEIQLSNLLLKMAVDTRVTPPTFWLCADDEDDLDERHSNYAGLIKRSFVPESFVAELRRTVLKGSSMADQLKAHFADGARKWSLTATRQTLGVMSGQEVRAIAAKKAAPLVDGVAGRITLSNAEVRVQILIACPKEDAVALASKVLRRDATLETGGADVFGELSNTIGGRARAAILEHGFDLAISLPEIVSDFMLEPSATWDLADWFETASGNRFFVAMAVEPTTPDGFAPRAATAAAPAAGGAAADAEAEDVLF
ncbi:MAG: response regulator [Gemmatimonadetes bacterium]|nr:response regulator [Gemmatimonadota bacterium]